MGQSGPDKRMQGSCARPRRQPLRLFAFSQTLASSSIWATTASLKGCMRHLRLLKHTVDLLAMWAISRVRVWNSSRHIGHDVPSTRYRAGCFTPCCRYMWVANCCFVEKFRPQTSQGKACPSCANFLVVAHAWRLFADSDPRVASTARRALAGLFWKSPTHFDIGAELHSPNRLSCAQRKLRSACTEESQERGADLATYNSLRRRGLTLVMTRAKKLIRTNFNMLNGASTSRDCRISSSVME